MRISGSLTLIATILVGLSVAKSEDLPPEFVESTNRSVAQAIKLDDPWGYPDGSIHIASNDKPNQLIVSFPHFTESEDNVVVLRFRTRLDTKRTAGWNNILKIDINGKPLAYKTASGIRRLINRKDSSIRTTDPRYPSNEIFTPSPFGGEAIFVGFSPSWDDLDKRIITDRKELYWYAFDVSGLLSESGDNTLTLTNLSLNKSFKDDPGSLTLMVDNLEVGYLPKSIFKRYVDNPALGIEYFVPSLTIKNDRVTVDVSERGGVRLSYLNDSYFLKSGFSEPAEHIIYNELSYSKDNQADVSISKQQSDSILIHGRFKYYDVDRLIEVSGRKLTIKDTFTNTSKQDVGVIFSNTFVGKNTSASWHLSGIENQSTSAGWQAKVHPTLFLPQKNSAVGIAVRDSRTRAGLQTEGSGRVLSFSNQKLGLKQGSSYTVRWEMYLGGTDYFEFINALRRDWGVNHTIPGMWEFWDPSVRNSAPMKSKDVLRKYLKRKTIDIFAITPWFEYYYKPEFWQPRQVYKEQLKKDIKFIRDVQPDAKFIACTESFLYYVPLTFFRGTLSPLPPNTRTDFNYKTTDATTDIINDSVWSDSVYRDKNGVVVLDRYYASRYSDTGVNLKVYPTLDNHWHKQFMGMLDYLINDCGLDGIYIDSFSQFSYTDTYRIWDKWDGHSVDIDTATGEITNKYTDMGLAAAPAKRQWLEYCIDRDKLIFVNGHPDSEELQSLPAISFVEAEYSLEPLSPEPRATRATYGQLSTPLALGVRAYNHDPSGKHYAEIIQRAVIAYLREGILYCHYYTDIPKQGDPGGGGYGVLNYMFPFTPVELHSGWVVGEERIISCVSGKFHWPKSTKPTVKRFDIHGIELDAGVQIQKQNDGWTIVVNLDDYNETIVIMDGAE